MMIPAKIRMEERTPNEQEQPMPLRYEAWDSNKWRKKA